MPAAGVLTISHVTHSAMKLGWDAAPGAVRKYLITYKPEDGELKEVRLTFSGRSKKGRDFRLDLKVSDKSVFALGRRSGFMLASYSRQFAFLLCIKTFRFYLFWSPDAVRMYRLNEFHMYRRRCTAVTFSIGRYQLLFPHSGWKTCSNVFVLFERSFKGSFFKQ